MKTTAELLRDARKAARLSQHDLVLLTGYSQGHIAQVELGTRIPSERCLRVLAEALGVPVEKLRGAPTSADFDRGFEAGYNQALADLDVELQAFDDCASVERALAGSPIS